MDYGNLVSGDKGNKTMMDTLQVLHNKAAKLVLDRPMFSSSRDALKMLHWSTLKQRRSINRCLYVYKSLNGLNDVDNIFIRNADVHGYNTRHKSDLRPLKSSTRKGLLRSNCNFIADWNLLDVNIRNMTCLSTFKRAVSNFNFLSLYRIFFFFNLLILKFTNSFYYCT